MTKIAISNIGFKKAVSKNAFEKRFRIERGSKKRAAEFSFFVSEKERRDETAAGTFEAFNCVLFKFNRRAVTRRTLHFPNSLSCLLFKINLIFQTKPELQSINYTFLDGYHSRLHFMYFLIVLFL